MKVTFWGTRGSLALSGENYSKYGGNTICVELESSSGARLVLDAGTGLVARAKNEASSPVILLSHYHKDHIEGLAFYKDFFSAKASIYAPLLAGAKDGAELIAPMFNGIQFPLKWQEIKSPKITSFSVGESFEIADFKVRTCHANHPGGCCAYRIECEGKSVGFSGDHEMREHDELIEFFRDCDLLIADGTFTKAEYEDKKGWGHSYFEQWSDIKVGQIAFFHHDPSHDDEFLDAIKLPFDNAILARDGMEIEVAGQIKESKPSPLEIIKKLSECSDSQAVLSTILASTRAICAADAGTIYLRQNDELSFACAQNDTLFPHSQANKFFYLNSFVKINKSSIVGYTASTLEALNIPDAYEIKNASFGFNKSFDEKSGYRTKSVLSLPLLSSNGELMGVLQLINASKNGQICAFDENMSKNVAEVCKLSMMALERAFGLEDMVMRMLKTSALRDPKETASHVWRVGCMAAELYQKWASDEGLEAEELLSQKSKLRLAAMLHDVGKVGIPDAVLKKPGRLDDDERAVMNTHAYLGSTLFAGAKSQIDKMAYDIALHHHAKWDGSGYSGCADIKSPAGKDIPLFARITTIVDVYDALVSRRIYKDAWSKDEAIAVLRKDAGSHFDPELVEKFVSILPLVDAIFEKYSE